ncbi:MAG: DUF2993 domain-containing protein [Cyanobacteria bacterium P01_D01_bin.156]
MEFISILLSSLLFIGSPIGFGLDTLAENALRSRLNGAEDIQVRVDNGSNFNLLKGKIDGLQVGTRGIYPVPGFRVAIADLETDPIDLDFGKLQRGKVVLDQPLNGALHVVITPEDLNQYLQSPEFIQQLNEINIPLDNAAQSREFNRYQLTNPKATFLANNRLQLELDLNDPIREENLKIKAQTGFTIENGHRLILLDPEVSVNDSPVPEQIFENMEDLLSLRRLEASGITTRILDASISPEQFDVTLWVSIDPSFTR